MNQKKELPLYGVGPIYVYCVVLLDVVGIILSHFRIIPVFELESIKIPCIFLGIILIIVDIIVWIQAVIMSKLDAKIKKQELVVTGVFGWMRNPIYSAITFAMFGVLLIYGNLLLLPFLFVDWLYLTLMMKNTEEKWLLDIFGDEYVAYCRRVNRFFPWFPRK